MIGDVMLDKFKYGRVERISPEAPVPVFKFDHEEQMLGGAGNVVANLVSLGCMTTFIGIIGKDTDGRKLSDLLSKIGAHSHLLRLNNYPTIVKTRFIAGNSHLLREDREGILPVITELLPRYERILQRVIKNVDVVLLSDYNKGLLTPITAQMIVKVCHQLGKIVIADPKGNDYSKYKGISLVKPNLKEFSEATGRKYDPKDINFKSDIISGAKRLFEKFKIQNILVTLSEYGMIFIPSNSPDEAILISTAAKKVYDVSGAGDTCLAVLGAALGSGAHMKDAMKLANIASGIAIGKLGTSTVSVQELLSAFSQKEISENGWLPKKKIVSLDQAKELVAKLKSKNKIIGFTNGCFDCCHLGHLNSFIQAKRLCDVLIVAMNSDSSIKRYKASNRPIQDEKTRALLLASLEFVDYVIVFEEDTPLHIVESLKPDIVAKEGYALENWPEGRLAISYGGKAVKLDHLSGYSTSNLIRKMES